MLYYYDQWIITGVYSLTDEKFILDNFEKALAEK